MKTYDLIIIGAGPAGITTAYQAVANGYTVLILEKGKDLFKRRNIISGWFGKGLFSSQKCLIKNTLNIQDTAQFFNILKNLYKPIKIVSKEDGIICSLSSSFGINLAKTYYDLLHKKIDVVFNVDIIDIDINNNFIIKTSKSKYLGKKCMIATGASSVEWINSICSALNLSAEEHSFKIGARIEVPTFKIKGIVDNYENIIIKDEYVATEDMFVNSLVGEWEDSSILSACGYCVPKTSSIRTNFMLAINSAKDLNETIKDIKIINILSNDRIKCERVSDYMEGKSVLTHIESFKFLREAFEKVEQNFPLISYATMYVPEIKIKGIFPVNKQMKTEIKFLYGAGECTMRADNVLEAMISGVTAFNTILKE
jgi:hypothetical protein